MKHIIKVTLLVTAAISLNFAAKAQGTLAWDWSWTSANYSGSGTFITTNVVSTTTQTGAATGFIGYLVLDMTGTLNGSPVTLAAVPGYFGAFGDNLLSSDSQQQLNVLYGGLAFSTASGQYLFYYNSQFGSDYLNLPNFGTEQGVFTATLVTVPEPSTLALAALGGLSGLYFIRRKK